jgi:U3 small nucleolar RNA-associated protein 22
MTAAPDDAALMMAASSRTPSTSSGITDGSTAATNNANTETLARSNLLRLETTALLSESSLHIHPGVAPGSGTLDSTAAGAAADGNNKVHYEARWSPLVRSYLNAVNGAITSLDACSLGPEVCVSGGGGGVSSERGMDKIDGGKKIMYRVPLLSDKFQKHVRGAKKSSSVGIGDNNNNNNSHPWSFPFQGGTSLSLSPIGSLGHLGNAGLANRHANGNVVPVLDVAVLFDEGFVGGKDYLNGRYGDVSSLLVHGFCVVDDDDDDDDDDCLVDVTNLMLTPLVLFFFQSLSLLSVLRTIQKRNILAVHIAKQLSQKKHRSKVGAVHLTNVFGDERKVALLLTPPLDGEDRADKGSGSKKGGKKRKKGEDKRKNKGKLRFRIRLIFGVKQANMLPKHHGGYNSNDENDDEESSIAWNCWIPRTRLFPNRCNNRSEKKSDHEHDDGSGGSVEKSTPHYTNSLAEDLHLVSTTHLISSTLSTLTATGSNVTPTSSFHETLLLLKVWALQRGFLRGHDTFTTTTLAVVLVYLYRTKGIGKRMGAMQGFTAFMKFWSEVDWLGEDSVGGNSGTSAAASLANVNVDVVLKRKVQKKAAFVIPEEGRNESQTISHCEQARLYLDDVRENGEDDSPKTLLECYKRHNTSSSSSCSFITNNSHHDSPILLDPTMTINFLARLSPSFIRESRAEANAALRFIHGHEREEVGGGVFRKLFLETNRFWTRYDAYVRIPMSVVPKIAVGGKKKGKQGGDLQVWGHDVEDLGYDESVCRGVVEVLSRAMGDRVTAIRAFTSGNGDIRATASVDVGEEAATKPINDSDQCHTNPIRGTSSCGYAAGLSDRAPQPPALPSTQDDPCLVVGLRIDPNASRRIVDRGPPAEDVEGSNAFVALWGEHHAQLRRFQDGAIVRAVVWNAPAGEAMSLDDVRFAGEDRSMGGIVERVAQHIVKLHFTDAKKSSTKQGKGPKSVSFELRNMVSFIDGVASTKQPSPFSDSLTLHKNAMSAFDSLADFLRRNTATTVNTIGGGKKASKLGLPLSIDEVEPLSPSLRYSALYPPMPHPLLGGSNLSGDKRKISGVVVGEPILIQIRFEGSSRWPSSLNAMGAAKCAMLIQLADGIEKMKQEPGQLGADDLGAFDGPIDVTPNYLDLGYRGFSFRIVVRADQELRMLNSLKNPTDEAKILQLVSLFCMFCMPSRLCA